MTVHNVEIADKFNKLANLLEIEGANPFRVRAYRNAARMIANLPTSLAEMVAADEKLDELPFIGQDLAEKIHTIIKTGELPLLKEMESRLPSVLNELLQVEGLGPKRVQILYKKLGIKSNDDLKGAIQKGRLRKLKGFGEKTEQKILQGLEHVKQYAARWKLADTMQVVESLLAYTKKIKDVKKIECAGSYRRRKETVGDLDILSTAANGEKVINHFVRFNEVAEILSQGTTRATVRLRSGIQVDLRVVPEESFGAALLYFTGSKEHNIALRKIAITKSWKLNEYGLFAGKKSIASATETDIYKKFELCYIEPELREDRGEIAAAKKNQLPRLITLNDMRGDLHCHTQASNGHASIAEMAEAAESLGYEYIAINDHSKHLKVAHGIDKKTLMSQIKTIDKLNAKLNKLTILKSCEVEILEDGKLDLADSILKELDFTICSVHSVLNLSAQKQTARILRAMDNPYFNIFGHPTDRLINERQPYAVDIEAIIRGAKERGCILELNAEPDRLDLNDIHCKMAKEHGVPIAIGSSAHSTAQLAFLQYGIYQARRGWLEKKDVVNTRSLRDLRKILRRK